MCGIIGIIGKENAAEELYRGLIALQHRGQDATGITTFSDRFHETKDEGLVQKVFNNKELEKLKGNTGIGHVRYATIGEGDPDETQPFHSVYPLAVSMCHNGNITNYTALREEIYMNTKCDLEAILNVFNKGMQRQFDIDSTLKDITKENIFQAIGYLMDTIEGSYSVVSHIPKVGMAAFRDQYGIKPLVYGKKSNAYCFTSESVALDALRYDYMDSVKPGEAVIADNSGQLTKQQIREPKKFTPCIFELIYFARPSSTIEGVSVSGFRYKLGKALAELATGLEGIDIVTDVPATSTRSAIAFANEKGIDYRPVFDKNNNIARSFIESSEFKRKHTVRLKFAIDKRLLKDLTAKLGRRIGLVKIDDSFVRGITNKTINELLRNTGMIEKIIDGSLSPRIEWPCVYGIDMSIQKEFVARGRTDDEVASELGADRVIYMSRESLQKVAQKSGLNSYCEACFSGCYPTGISKEDLTRIENERIKSKICKS